MPTLQELALGVTTEEDMDVLFDALFDVVHGVWKDVDRQQRSFAAQSKPTIDDLDAYLGWFSGSEVISKLGLNVIISSLRLPYTLAKESALPSWKHAVEAARVELDRRGEDTPALLSGLIG